jgi:hexosaminidase
MKKILFGVFILLNTTLPAQVSIIPQPVSVVTPKVMGQFVINANTPIILEASGLMNVVNFLNDYLQEVYGFQLKVRKEAHGTPAIFLGYQRLDHPNAGAYAITIHKKGIYIDGDNEAGTFYGMQSLLQMLPVTISASLKVPFVSIQDHPRFEYRGLHLDVSRHFFPVDYVKRYIDYIALHKMNYFHWHLTDDQGWRIEIKKYPRLTEVGAWRDGTIIGHHPGTGNDNTRHGGFYTQEEVKEVVAYAAARYITVVPEIEMPGHASAALAGFPNLGCTGGPYTVQQTWGVFRDVFCAGNDTVFNFLQDVLDEVIPLFPAKYVHVGGDECPKDSWKACSKCQKRIKDLNLKDEHELQSYFIQRMEKYINSKGKTIIGWDEILEGGLAPNAVVMSWRGESGGIEAAKQNHDVIMTPTTYVYLDYSQTKREDSLVIGGYLPLEKVYNYEPLPKELTPAQAKRIIGAQANLWTEYITNAAKVEYMIFPRATALSEVLWSPKEKKNWVDFQKRLQTQFKRYDLWGTNYSKAFFDINATVLPAPRNNGVLWKLEANMAQNNFDLITHNISDKHVSVHKDKVVIPIPVESEGSRQLYHDSVIGTVAKYSYNQPILITSSQKKFASLFEKPNTYFSPISTISQTFRFNKATGNKITLTKQPGANFPGQGGAFGLVNGIQSERGIASPDWLGFQGNDMDAIIDLGKSQSISTVNVHVMTANGSQTCKPKFLEVFRSIDGKNFVSLAQTNEIKPDSLLMGNMNVSFAPVSTRYVKVLVKNIGIIPDGMPGSGNKAWLYVDEIQVD